MNFVSNAPIKHHLLETIVEYNHLYINLIYYMILSKVTSLYTKRSARAYWSPLIEWSRAARTQRSLGLVINVNNVISRVTHVPNNDGCCCCYCCCGWGGGGRDCGSGAPLWLKKKKKKDSEVLTLQRSSENWRIAPWFIDKCLSVKRDSPLFVLFKLFSRMGFLKERPAAQR